MLPVGPLALARRPRRYDRLSPCSVCPGPGALPLRCDPLAHLRSGGVRSGHRTSRAQIPAQPRSSSTPRLGMCRSFACLSTAACVCANQVGRRRYCEALSSSLANVSWRVTLRAVHYSQSVGRGDGLGFYYVCHARRYQRSATCGAWARVCSGTHVHKAVQGIPVRACRDGRGAALISAS